MRKAARTDNNHKQIATALKRIRAVVFDIHQLPNLADLLVGFRGKWFLLEIKDEEKLPKKFWSMEEGEKRLYLQKLLTKGEGEAMTMSKTVNAPYHIVYSIDSAFEAIGANKPNFQ